MFKAWSPSAFLLVQIQICQENEVLVKGSVASGTHANLPIPILRLNVVGEGLWFVRAVVVVAWSLGEALAWLIASWGKAQNLPWAWGSSFGPTYSILMVLPHSEQRSIGRSLETWQNMKVSYIYIIIDGRTLIDLGGSRATETENHISLTVSQMTVWESVG